MTNHYYLVGKRSPAHKIITAAYAQRAAASKARWKFLTREFPEATAKKSGFGVASWGGNFGGRRWAVAAPAGFKMTPDWKHDAKSNTWSPRHGTKRGKALVAEMLLEAYYCPGPADIGQQLGCPPTFVGLALVSCGISPLPDGRYLLILNGAQTVPQGTARISDLRAEQLQSKKIRKKPAGKQKASAI